MVSQGFAAPLDTGVLTDSGRPIWIDDDVWIGQDCWLYVYELNADTKERIAKYTYDIRDPKNFFVQITFYGLGTKEFSYRDHIQTGYGPEFPWALLAYIVQNVEIRQDQYWRTD